MTEDAVHLFTAPMQPAMRFENYGGLGTIEYSTRTVFRCRSCKRRRWAQSLRVQVFYDGICCYCAEGCKWAS
jgi:hypothetical protein